MIRFARLFPACLLAWLALALPGTPQAANYLVMSGGDVANGNPANCTGSATSLFCDTLRDAIAAANASPEDDSISFHPLYALSVTLAHGPLVIADAGTLSINGGRGNGSNLPISGNNARRVFQIEADARATLRKVNVINGQVGFGEAGAGIANAGTLTLEYSTVSGNSGYGAGGINNTGTLDIRFSTISGNGSYHAGGIGNTGALSLLNSTVSDNSAFDTGGISNSGTLRLEFSTVADNHSSVSTAGGLYSMDGQVSLIGSVLADNSGGDCARTGGSIDASHSLIADGLACINGTSTANLQGNAKLDALLSNDGYTQTHHPLMGSPLIDAAPCDLVPGIDQDQRGTERPQGSRCDIGAVEMRQMVVDTVADESDYNGFCSLREALINANANAQTHADCAPGLAAYDHISFDPAVFNGAGNSTIVLGSALPNLTGNTVIDGTRGDGGHVSVSGNDTVRVFYIAPGATAILRRLNVVSGKTPSGGGGIRNHGTLFIEHSTVSNNSGGNGGGIINFSALTIQHSTVSDNIAESGGGIYSPGSLIIRYSTVSGNTTSANGGGMCASVDSHSTVIEHSTVSGNSAASLGGGIHYHGTRPMTVAHSTVAHNAANSGGGIQSQGGIATLTATVIANSANGGDCVRSSGTVHATGSLIEDGLGCVNGTNTGNLTGDALLGDLSDHGGETHTHLPLPGSPLIDAVTCMLVADNTRDQRGIARPQGAQCDIGSVEVRQYPLSIAVTGDGSVSAGTPAPPVGGIADCRENTGICAADYPESFVAPVTLTAIADAGSRFVAWGGDCSGTATQATLSMGAARTCTATFAIATHTVTPSVPGGHGSMSPDVPQTVEHSETVSFTLTPETGYRIDEVTSSCGGTLAGDVFTTAAVLADCDVIAHFTRLPNSAPSLSILGNQGQSAGSTGVFTVPGFATVTSFGTSPWEAEQSVLAYEVQLLADPGSLLFGLPTIALDGTLNHVLSGNSGSASLRMRVRDNGGTAEGGVDVSEWHTFAITVGEGLDVAVSIPSAVAITDTCRLADITVLVQNLGTVAANGVQVDVMLPPSLATTATWTCTPVGNGAACPPSGSGAIDHGITLPRNAGVLYRITGQFFPGPDPLELITAQATIAGDVFPDNDTATAPATVCLFGDGYESPPEE